MPNDHFHDIFKPIFAIFKRFSSQSITKIGLIVLVGLTLNIALTITPTKTEAVFGGQDSGIDSPFSKGSTPPPAGGGIFLVNDIVDLAPLDFELEADIPGITDDAEVAQGQSLFPGSSVILQAKSGAQIATAKTYGGTSRANYLPEGCEWGVKEGRFVAGAHTPHNAQDIAAPTGTPVIASCDGIVVSAQYSGYNGGYGLNIIIDHGNFKTRYGHLSDILVTAGQSVVKGERIGKVGNTGRSTGPHLHFEVW